MQRRNVTECTGVYTVTQWRLKFREKSSTRHKQVNSSVISIYYMYNQNKFKLVHLNYKSENLKLNVINIYVIIFKYSICIII